MATGANDILTPEQLNILQSASLGTEIVVHIQYQFLNDITHQIEDRSINYSTTIVPETEAEFPGGDQQLRQYFQGNAIDKLSEESSASLQQTVVRFTVDEQGDIANTQVVQSSGDAEIDEMFLDAINNMPEWKPAQDAQGIAVRQDFQFSVGNNTGC
jgi:TonB family protein